MKIATYGSCLSRFTATNYARMFGATIVGSVYHNRIDRFVDTYVRNRLPEVPLEALGDYATGSSERGRVIINNQLSSQTLGKHGTIQGRGFMTEIEDKVDLVIMDNFIDILGKVCQVKGVKSSGLFINPAEVPTIADRLTLEPGYLDIDVAVRNWEYMINWLRRKHKGKIYFINFPFAQHPNPRFKARTIEFEEKFKSPRIRIIPILEAHPTLQSTPSHFDSKYYAMLAAYIWKDLYASNRSQLHSKEEQADDIFHRAKDFITRAKSAK